jgi:hypothetical protein
MEISATRSIALLLLEKGEWHCGWGESVIFANMMHKFQKISIILKETPRSVVALFLDTFQNAQQVSINETLHYGENVFVLSLAFHLLLTHVKFHFT